MGNIYFKSLEEKLNDGYYIVACYGGKNAIITYMLKDNAIADSANNGNLITCLNQMSLRDECDKKESSYVGRTTLIDAIIKRLGYTLHIYKLANNKILISICRSYNNEYIPIKSLMTDSIISGIETLDGILRKKYNPEFQEDFLYNFYGETHQHFNDVVEYQKKLTPEKH